MTDFLHNPPKNLFLPVKGASVKPQLRRPQCLPLVMVNVTVISNGCYPGNEQLRLLLKNNGFAVTLAEEKKSGCGCRPGCC